MPTPGAVPFLAQMAPPFAVSAADRESIWEYYQRQVLNDPPMCLATGPETA
jgi:hypothetical protein